MIGPSLGLAVARAFPRTLDTLPGNRTSLIVAASVKEGSLPAFAALVKSGRIGAAQPFLALRLNSQTADLVSFRCADTNARFAFAALEAKSANAST